MRVLKIFLAYSIGFLLFPIYWVLGKLGVISTPEEPDDFVQLVGHFHKHDLWPVLSMREEKVADVEALAWLSFGMNPNVMSVVTVARCATEELAENVEKELERAPQYTCVGRKGQYVMGCTFIPPNPELERKVEQAFSQFRGAG